MSNWMYRVALILAGVALLAGCRSGGDVVRAGELPPQEPREARFKTLVSATSHVCALEISGQVACWGGNEHGQLGTGDTEARAEPTFVEGITDAIDVVTARRHTCVLHEDGGVSCWGGSGLLGDGQPKAHWTNKEPGATRPVPVLAPGGSWRVGQVTRTWCPEGSRLTGVTALAATHSHTCAVHKSGAVLCWGESEGGLMGAAATALRDLPCPMPVEGIDDARAVAVSSKRVCATLADGQVVCWGYEPSEDKSPGPLKNRFTNIETFTELAGARRFFFYNWHQCAQLASGELRCAGHESPEELEALPANAADVLDLGGNLCVVRHNAAIVCLERGSMVGIRLHRERVDGSEWTRSFTPHFGGPTWSEEHGQLRALVEAPDDLACLLTDAGRLFCLDSPAEGDDSSGLEWQELSMMVEPDPAGLRPTTHSATAAEPEDHCPKELVLGDPSWPNHMTFEHQGRRLTVFMERTVAEFYINPRADIHFPDLAFHTAANANPRTDGWQTLKLSTAIGEAGAARFSWFEAGSLTDTIGCFRIPKRLSGAVTFDELVLPEFQEPGGVFRGSFDMYYGSPEFGRVSGVFATEQNVQHGHAPIDPEHNSSSFGRDQLEPEVGVAIFRVPTGEFYAEMEGGELSHARRLTGFSGVRGVYMGSYYDVYAHHDNQGHFGRARTSSRGSWFHRLSLERFGPREAAGKVEATALGDEFFTDQLLTSNTTFAIRSTMRFSLPLVVVPHPGALELVDPEVAPGESKATPVAKRLLGLPGQEQVFGVFGDWDAVGGEVAHAVDGQDESFERGLFYTIHTSLYRQDDGTLAFRHQTRQRVSKDAIRAHSMRASSGPNSQLRQGPPVPLRERDVQLQLSAETFRPLNRQETLTAYYDDEQIYALAPEDETSKLVTELEASFAPDAVRVVAENHRQPRGEAKITGSNIVYDSSQVLWLVPLLDLAPGRRFQFGVFHPHYHVTPSPDRPVRHRIDPRTYAAELAVQARTTITIGNDERAVLRAVLRYGGVDAFEWVFFLEPEAPHHLVAVDTARGIIVPLK